MKLSKLLLVGSIPLALTLSSCGERVNVPTGQVAKIIGTSGLKPNITKPRSFRLESCFFTACEKLSRLEVFEDTLLFQSTYYISEDKLDLTLDLKIQYKLNSNPDDINSVYSRVKSVPELSGHRMIKISRVFDTYITPVLKDTVRETLNNYSMNQIMDNISEVKKVVEKVVIEKTKNTPITINSITFSKIAYPESITEKRVEAARVDSEKIISLKRIAAEIEVSEQRKLLMIKDARIAVEADKIVSKSMDKKMATWLFLNSFDKCAENTGGCSISIHPSMIPMLSE